MIKKIIIITRCVVCPYYREKNILINEHCTNFKNNIRLFNNIDTCENIPNWCNLIDYNEK